MRKLNKIIKQHTTKKMSRKKKTIEIIEYFDYLVSFIDKREEFEKETSYFKKIREFVFLEKYFNQEMIEAKVDLSDLLFEYIDFDLYAIDDKKVKEMYSDLSSSENEIMNRIKLVFVKVKEIQPILKEYYS